MTGGGPAAAARRLRPGRATRISPPTALPGADRAGADCNHVRTQKILVRPSGAEGPTFANARWSDNLPKLLHARLIHSFENANLLRAVARPTDGLTADHQLQIDIRKFQLSMAAEPLAEVEIAAKIVSNDGKIVAARIFHATAPAGPADAAAAAAALNEAFGKIAVELVTWTMSAI